MGAGELTWNQLWEIWQNGIEIHIRYSCYNYLTCIIRIFKNPKEQDESYSSQRELILFK